MATHRDGSSSQRHECPNCETVFIGTDQCPRCEWRVGVPPQTMSGRPEWLPSGERPCTPAQGKAASRIVMAIAMREISVDEGKRRMAALFPEATAS